MKPATKAVHGGEAGGPSGAVNTPIVHSTTYRYPEAADGGASDYIYTRYTNPTVETLEQKYAALEGAERGLAFASGMGAIAAVCQTFLRPGDTLAVQSGVYGGTTAYLTRELAPMGITIRTFAIDEPADFAGATMVWMESMSNPLLRIPDLAAWAKAAHDAGAKFVVDATFVTPILQRPLELGADIVIHSATKYLCGHSDVTAGVVGCSAADRDAIWETRRNLGATLDPLAAALVIRGMKTLVVRMERHMANAATLAAALSGHPKVKRVIHPTHPDHPDAGHDLPGGGMLVLDVGSAKAAVKFRRKTRIIAPAASLGGVESLLSLPMETSHAYMPASDRRALGIGDGLIRISVGIEDAEDLLADIEQAL